jgi:hypothetical protein
MNNPYAFPAMHIDLAEHEHGMSLRDYFAAKAMQAIIAGNITGQECEDRSWLEADQWAPRISYEIADAMLRARVKP